MSVELRKKLNVQTINAEEIIGTQTGPIVAAAPLNSLSNTFLTSSVVFDISTLESTDTDLDVYTIKLTGDNGSIYTDIFTRNTAAGLVTTTLLNAQRSSKFTSMTYTGSNVTIAVADGALLPITVEITRFA